MKEQQKRELILGAVSNLECQQPQQWSENSAKKLREIADGYAPITVDGIKSLGFKEMDFHESIVGLYVLLLPNKWEVEIWPDSGEGKLFPPNCEEFPSHVPLLFKSISQLKQFIEAFCH